MSKVKKMEKAEVSVMMPRLDGGYEEVKVVKNLWKCTGCGLVWNMRHEAKDCEANGHKPFYVKVYGGYYHGEQRVGGTTVIFNAVRKEEVN
jgi:hypothetical protein